MTPITPIRDDLVACTDFCFRRSWCVRRTPTESRQMIRSGLELLKFSENQNYERFREEMESEARCRYRMRHQGRRPRSIGWWLIFVKIVLPILIQLVWKWWNNRNREGWKA